MEINTPEVKKKVIEYDFLLSSGIMLPITIDPEAGDTVSFTDGGVVVHLEPKPSQNDPDVLIPGEDITVFARHLIAVTKREREVTQLTPDQKHQWRKTVQELNKGKTIH